MRVIYDNHSILSTRSWALSARLCYSYCEAEELKNVLRTLGEQLDDDDISEMLKLAEVDKEGRINYLGMFKKVNKIINR